MIYDGAALPTPATVTADLCVVGSGPGGAGVAMVAAEAGLDVLVLEEGSFLTPSDMSQREERMLPALLMDGGIRSTRDRAVQVVQGRGVGGSSLHNTNLCKRIPRTLLEEWATERRLSHLPPEAWDALYAEVESLLAVAPIGRDYWNRHNLLLEAGCKALGWRGGGLSHNRTDCKSSGVCELGCAYDSKNNAAKILIPRAVKAGAQVVTHCRAVHVRHAEGRAYGVSARIVDPRSGEPRGEVEVRAPRVCLSASATGTPVLLRRSGVPDPGGETGERLRLHPAVVVAGEFEEEVAAFGKIPQTYECTEWLDFGPGARHRVWIVPVFAHPMAFAAMLPQHGAAHRGLMERYSHLAVLTAMVHDETAGSVRPRGEARLEIDYWPDERDRRELAFGLEACARLLLAAGARRVLVPASPPRELKPGDDPSDLARLPIRRGEVPLTAVHPLGSVPMGDEPAVAAVDSRGRHHHVKGLWVADASLFPTSTGGPPQLSVYALGLHVGRALVAAG